MDFHALIVFGGSSKSRMETAKTILKEHFKDDSFASEKIDNGTFEDLLILEAEPNKKDITVDKVKMLVDSFAQKPFVSTSRAAIIVDGEKMNEHAQNKLLKVLEEPAGEDIILILTSNPEMLLPTIRSRCITKWLGYDDESEYSDMINDVKSVVRMLLFGTGTLSEAFAELGKYEDKREDAEAFLNAMLLLLRDLAVGSYAPSVIYNKDLEEAASKANPKLVAIIRKDILIIERALVDIALGYRIKYSLRDMALCLKQEANNA